jgi:transposase
VADGKLYDKDTAEHLKSLPFITRIPHTLKVVSQVITQALAIDTWHDVDVQTRYQRLELCHYGMAQRWLVVFSQAAAWRAETAVRQAQHKEYDAIQQQLFHLQAQRFESQTSAYEALSKLGKKWRYHHLDSYAFTAHKRYGTKGRPTPRTPIKATEWQIEAQVLPEAKRINHAKQLGACYVIGSNIPFEQLSDVEVITGYKAQAQAEGGFRFLKDPLFFVSSLFVKKPSRIQGLLMVMTLALLVYSVTQRRLRQALARQNDTLPNQIHQPTRRPTLRWVFQLLEGIHRVRVTVQDQVHTLIEGLNEVRIKILRLFGEKVCQVYHIASG